MSQVIANSKDADAGHARAMLTVDQARAAMLAAIKPLAAETVPLAQAGGRVLAQAVTANRDHPPYPASEMDGYAVRSSDTPGRLHLAGESAAGRGYAGDWATGSCIRISTGAAVPDGADAVVIQENVTRAGNEVTVPAAGPGQHIRPRGLDFSTGAALLPKGRRLDGTAQALVAACGMAAPLVSRMPRIALLSGGDELAEPGAKPGPFQVYDSGTYGLTGLIGAWGGLTDRLALQKDDAGAISRAAESGLRQSDLLVIIGGASVGDHDHARPALKALGLQLVVEKVALRPGKPTWFGHTPLGPVLGLPGNPASALVCAHLFLRPLMDAMLGRDPLDCVRLVKARLAADLPANGPREHYLRARLTAEDQGHLSVLAFENQDSSLLSVFASANALIRLPANASSLAQGALVDVLKLDAP